MAKPPRNNLEEAEDQLPDDWFPAAGRAIYIAGVIVAALDFIILQRGVFNLSAIRVAGVALFLTGLCIYGGARLTLGRFFSESIRILPEHRLVRTGPYGLVRHPIYLGEILIFLGIPIIFASLYGFVVELVLVPMLLHRIGIEERILSRRFGQEYLEYVRRTKKLVPYIY